MPLASALQVMVVDDMTVSRALIEQSLDQIGISKVLYEPDGDRAFKRVCAQPVHLVISDYNMPVMNGLDLLQHLRTNKATQKIGFILISGTPTREMVDRGRQLGMNNMLTKPFTTDSMKKAIESVFGPLQ